MTYLSTILADAPLHYWRMLDGGGGYAKDIGSRGMHLLQPNGASVRPIDHFSGPDSSGASALFLSGVLSSQWFTAINIPFSIEAWFYFVDGDTPANVINIISESHDAGGAQSWQFSVAPGLGTFNLVRGVNGGSQAFTRYHWHHLVVTDDGAFVRSYLDAVASGAPGVSAGAGAVGGGNIGVGGGFLGTAARMFIAEVAIYGSALSAAKVTNHFVAADQPSIGPTFAANSTSVPSVLSDILAAVRKSF